MEQGKYIVLEGGEACGKDSQLARLGQTFKKEKIDYAIVREPHDAPIMGPKIKNLLTCDNEVEDFNSLSSWQQADLMNQARREIMPRVKEYRDNAQHVLASRFYCSTMVYQGYGAGLTGKELSQLRKQCFDATDMLMPTLVLILDVSYEVAQARMQAEGRTHDVNERQGREFHEGIRLGYLKEAKLYFYPVIDADQPFDDVAKKVWSYVEPHLFKERT